ncbi:MAG: TerC family protein, partial [Eggerthellaceae bacterium]|nr:TerC family protein [Eggerthellaceae bacterium]
MDFSIFLTAEAWISLLTLVFLEIVLGVDNIAFIALTTNRLPESKQHIGRKLGLAGAMIMRVIFLCFASWLIHMTQPVFTVDLGFHS